MDRLAHKIEENVSRFGWHIQFVMPTRATPGFGYSIGLTHTHRHPELILVGLPQQSTKHVINALGKEIAQGARFEPWLVYSALVDGVDTQFGTMHRTQYELYLGRAIDFYDKQPFSVLQIIYPDPSGRWPDDPDVSPGLRRQQPDLTTRLPLLQRWRTLWRIARG